MVSCYSMSPDRERLLRLVSVLPEDAVPEAVDALAELVRDPAARALAEAVEYEEYLTPEVHPALEQVRKEILARQGTLVPEESRLA
jgi:hypothetical protein